MNTQEIIENNRQIITNLIDKIREKKEFDAEEATYLKILLNNGLIDKKGQITKEGIEALYH